MSVKDYELLLRVRADLQQALGGLDGMRKKLEDVGKETERTSARASKSVDGMSDKFGKLKALIGGLAIAAGIKGIFGAVTESENAVAQLDARLKSTGNTSGLTRDQLIDLSKELEHISTNGDEAVLSVETLLLTFGNIKGPVFRDATKIVLDMSTALGQDLQTSARQVGLALNDPLLGITKLQKANVTFSDEQKTLIKTLVQTGQAAAAQGVVLDALSVKFGGAAEAAANTFGGALKQLKEAAGDLMEGDGGNLPQMTESVKSLTAPLRDPQVQQGFAAMISGLTDVAGFAAKAAGAFAGFGTAVADVFRDNENKSYLGLLQKRMRLDDKITALQDNPIAGRLGWNKGEIDDLKHQLAAVDKLILLRNQAVQPKAANAAPGAGIAAPIDTLPTVTVNLSKQEAADKAAADKAAAAAAKVAAAAAAAAKAGAAAQKEQVASLVALQAALDPTAKVWADYNAEVEKQNGLADVQKAAAGANVAAIDARRNAILQLAASARDATIAAQQQADAKKHLDDSMQAAPSFQGVDAVVAGPAGELIKAVQASAELEAWHAKSLAENQGYYDNLLAIEKKYAAEKAAIDEAKTKLAVDTAVAGFGALASAMKSAYGEQSKQYRIAFALQKAAALAQAILAIQTSIANSASIGFPWNIVTIAGAIAQGVSVLANINSATFADGGYTGPGGKYQPAGVVHAGEVVWSQEDIHRAGGVAVVEALRRGRSRGYADGGFVHPLAGMPGLVVPGMDAMGSLRSPAATTANVSGAPQVHTHVRVLTAFDVDDLTQKILSTRAGEKLVVAHVIANGSAVKHGIGIG